MSALMESLQEWTNRLAEEAFAKNKHLPAAWSVEFEDGKDGCTPAGWYLIGLDDMGWIIDFPVRHEYGPFKRVHECWSHARKAEKVTGMKSVIKLKTALKSYWMEAMTKHLGTRGRIHPASVVRETMEETGFSFDDEAAFHMAVNDYTDTRVKDRQWVYWPPDAPDAKLYTRWDFNAALEDAAEEALTDVEMVLQCWDEKECRDLYRELFDEEPGDDMVDRLTERLVKDFEKETEV